MNRPTKFDRNQAVEIALDYFWLNGIDASSVKRLSEELLISRSSFYNSFGSVEALFRESLERYIEQVPGADFYRMTPEKSLRTELTRMLYALCQIRANDAAHRGCLATNCLVQTAPHSGETGELLCSKFAFIASKIEEKLRWAVESGELPAETDPRITAIAVQNLMLGINVQSMMTHDADVLWQSCDLALRGMGLLDETFRPKG